MPQDAFHIKRLVDELNERIVGGAINRISQADKDELTFIIYTGKSTVKLLFSTNASFARVCLTETEKDPLPVAPNFCMLLRKHLLGGTIVAVRQHEFERIVEVEIFCKRDFHSERCVLIAEIMGKYSNLVLTREGVILGALKTTSLETNARRILFSGANYLYPEPQDKCSPFDTATLRAREQDYFSLREKTEETVADFVFTHVSGLAISTAREIAKRLPRQTPLHAFLPQFCESEENRPHLLLLNGVPTDFFAFPVANGVPEPSLLAAADEYYFHRETGRIFSEKQQRALGAIRAFKKKRSKAIADVLERLKEAENAEEFRRNGELITANFYRLTQGMSSFTTQNWYSENAEEVTIQLDPLLSPQANAQRCFKSYAKAKRTKSALVPRLEQEQKESDYADSILSSVERAETLDDLKEIETELILLGLMREPQKKIGGKKKESVTPFREYEHAGFTILAGRNNLQNDRLLKESDGTDLWLHTQKYHSAHVIIRAKGRHVPDEVVKYAAEICAYYSDGKDGDKIPVDYCQRAFVKKPPKAKAGAVVYSNQKTALVTPNAHK